MIYSSKQNPLIKKIASLKDKKGRREHGLYIVEGVKMVTEAVKYSQPIKYLVVCENVDISFNVDCEVLTVSEQVFSYLSDEITPQGVLAVIKTPDLSVSEPISNAIILDGIQDPGNMGTIVRTAIASGYSDIYLISCVDPFSPKAVRSSMSGVYFANFHKCSYDELFVAISNLELIIADFGGENLFGYKPKSKFALAIGNEGNGISQTLKERANTVLTIPMDSKVESLNASVASAIMMYELKSNS